MGTFTDQLGFVRHGAGASTGGQFAGRVHSEPSRGMNTLQAPSARPSESEVASLVAMIEEHRSATSLSTLANDSNLDCFEEHYTSLHDAADRLLRHPGGHGHNAARVELHSQIMDFLDEAYSSTRQYPLAALPAAPAKGAAATFAAMAASGARRAAEPRGHQPSTPIPEVTIVNDFRTASPHPATPPSPRVTAQEQVRQAQEHAARAQAHAQAAWATPAPEVQAATIGGISGCVIGTMHTDTPPSDGIGGVRDSIIGTVVVHPPTTP